MTIFGKLIEILWFIIVAYWLVSALRAKRSVNKSLRWLNIPFRITIIIVIFLLLHIPFFANLFKPGGYFTLVSNNILVNVAGVIICTLGILLAIWARINIGKNWGMPMSLRENPDLVTSGPYAFIRHPIYSGFLLAILGSTLVLGLIGLIPLVLAFLYFMFSLKKEEKDMLRLFPKDYPNYKKRTKALIPFIW